MGHDDGARGAGVTARDVLAEDERTGVALTPERVRSLAALGEPVCVWCGRMAARVLAEIQGDVEDCVWCSSCARNFVRVRGRWFEAGKVQTT